MEISSPASEREPYPDLEDTHSPVWGWSRLHRTAAYCVDLYAGSTSKPWVGREICGHCGNPAAKHEER